jgi:hypothetical protein
MVIHTGGLVGGEWGSNCLYRYHEIGHEESKILSSGKIGRVILTVVKYMIAITAVHEEE